MKNIVIIIIAMTILIIIAYSTKEKYEKFETLLKPTDKLKLLEVLLMFHEVFEKHGIWYIIAYGTLLGAVRHHTLIPWDDDADVLVKITDIEKVKSALIDLEKLGFKVERLWKLYRVYGKDSTTVWIDIFFCSEVKGKIVRCTTNNAITCEHLEKKADWWWNGFDFDAKYLNERKKFEYSGLSLWGPVNSWQLLKAWYGDDFLTKCKTHYYDHKTESYIPQKIVTCSNDLPNPQF